MCRFDTHAFRRTLPRVQVVAARTVIVGAALTAAATVPLAATAETMYRLDPIVVTVGRLPELEERTLAPVGVVDRREIERRQAEDLDAVLLGIPGVTTAGGPREEALDPNIRGLGEGRVVIRLDGARQNLNIRHRGQTFIDPALFERVEVLRGPGSTLYGSGAIGGVISLRTLEPSSVLEPGKGFGGRAIAGYQDNGRRLSGGLTLAARGESTEWLGAVSLRDSSDFRDGDGDRVDFTGSDVLSGLLKGSWDIGEAQRLTLSHLAFTDDSRSLVTADRPTGVEIDREIRQHTTTLRHEFAPADSLFWDLETTLYHTDLRLDEAEVLTTNSQRNELETIGLDAFNTSLFLLGDRDHTLTYGVELYRDRQKGSENGQPREGFADSRQNTLGLFAQDRIGLTERLELTAGLRYDRIRQSADREGSERNRLSELSPQLALRMQVSPALAAHMSYAEAFRAPALRELYIGGQHFPGNEYIPNPDLKPEKSHNLEVGVTYRERGLRVGGDRLTFRAALFQNDIDDFIEQVVQADTTQFINVADARVRGLELELRYDHPDFYAAAGASMQRGDNRGRDEPLQSIPGDRLVFEGGWRWQRVDLETGARFSLNRSQNRVPDRPFTIGPTPGYNLVDLFMTWRPAERWTVDAGVDNLTNKTYRRHLSQLNDPGRNVRMQAIYRF